MGIAEDKKGLLGKNIKRLREEHKMSQRQLAGELWIDRSSLSNYEIGKRQPDISMLCRIADIFGLPLDELVGRNVRE